MDSVDSGDDSEHDLISTEMLESIHYGIQYDTNVNRIESSYKKRDRIRQRQSEWKGALKYTQNMGKVLHKVFKTVVKDISQDLPRLGESGSEFSHLIPEPRNFAEVTILLNDIKKPELNENMKDIKNLINNQTFLVEDPNNDEPVTPCMDVYKSKIQSHGSLDKLKLIIVVREDLHNKELVGDT